MSGSDDPYVYPGTKTLKNRLGIIDPAKLTRIERAAVSQRITEGIPTGAFDLTHLQPFIAICFRISMMGR